MKSKGEGKQIHVIGKPERVGRSGRKRGWKREGKARRGLRERGR
jgi:hypothetical protein